ncbi:MAG: VanZ family protein [Adlercreutzia sp.]
MQAVQEQLLGPGVDARRPSRTSASTRCSAHFWPTRCAATAVVRAFIAIACASLYGVSDEVHQLFVPERMCDPVDWMVDTAERAGFRDHVRGAAKKRCPLLVKARVAPQRRESLLSDGRFRGGVLLVAVLRQQEARKWVQGNPLVS